ncbi:hypothetical protein GJT80_01330 [Enterobacteriaceae endosymbiont of Plateumaris braccata]|nr:hypothetical protein GJT80_01330 [Enterobacteriaceae endosymbiont of Plateumaris braccata]
MLKKWCNLMGVKVIFFLIGEKYFRKENILIKKPSFNIINKNLLLDEFYRTAVRMAGKPIIWNIIPINKENCYNDYVNFLYKKNFLLKNEWLDLGGLKNISVENYFKYSL